MADNYSALLEDNISKRREQDKPLINFFLWGVFLLVGIVLATIISMLIAVVLPEQDSSYALGSLLGLGLSLGMVYIQTNRVNAFIARKAEWYTNLVNFTNQYSGENIDLTKLNDLINPVVFNTRMKIIDLNNSLIFIIANSVLGAIITMFDVEQVEMILLIFVFLIIVAVMCVVIYEYPMNAIWNKLQCFENEFDDTLSEVWKENAWIEKPIEFDIDPSKKRNYFLWMFYSIITLGVMMFIWNYKIYTDPDFMYHRFHEKEDQILKVISKIEQ